jgi:CRP-like cAMP-binding protein
VPFFKGISPEALERINRLFYEKGYTADETICGAGDPAERLFVIADGRVRLVRHSLSGKEIVLDILASGEFFGSLSTASEDVYLETAQAQTPACVLTIGREVFRQILDQHPSVALKVLDIMSVRLQASNERVHQLSVLPVEGRIASLLLRLSDKFGERRGEGMLIQVPLSRNDLAAMTGTTPETASRVMSSFQKAGWIQTGREWVSVMDRASLEAMTGGE